MVCGSLLSHPLSRPARHLRPQVLKKCRSKIAKCLRCSSLKGRSQLWERADLDTSFLTLKKVHPNLESKVYQDIRSKFHSVLLDFQSFTEKPVFKCPFAHAKILFVSYLVENSIYRVSGVCKLAMKRYLMRMETCA